MARARSRPSTFAVPAGSLDFWEARLREAGTDVARVDMFGTSRLSFAHPSGIPYTLVGVDGDDRVGNAGGGVPPEHAVHGAHGITVSVRDGEEMAEFLEQGLSARGVSSEGGEAFEVGQGGLGRYVELVEEPDVRPGTWRFGEGTVHHVAFDASDSENQMALKLHLEGIAYTDVSDVKDRQYFHSCYVRTPGGPLFELAVSVPDGWAVDEAPEALGRSFRRQGVGWRPQYRYDSSCAAYVLDPDGNNIEAVFHDRT